MEFRTHIRKPFSVKAVEVTAENIEEIASMTGMLCHRDDGTPFIEVDPEKVRNIKRAHVGFWLTKMDGNLRFYAPWAFNQQFVRGTQNVHRAARVINGGPSPAASVKA